LRRSLAEDGAMNLETTDSFLRSQNQERDFEPKFERDFLGHSKIDFMMTLKR